MSKQEKQTIVLNSIFNFGATLVSQFISVYLYIYTKSLPMMCAYIIVRIGLFPIFFTLGFYLSKKFRFALTYTIGLMLITFGLVIALISGPIFEANPYYVLVVAAIIGSGEGFYYFSANNSNQLVSSSETRASFLAYNGIFNHATAFLAPIYSAAVLERSVNDMEGYRVILMSIIAIFIFVIAMAFNLSTRSKDGKSSLLKALSLNDKKWRNHIIGVMCYGMRDAVGLNVIGLLVYEAAGSGGLYSRLHILFSFLAIVSYYLSKIFLSKDKTDRTMKIGVLLKILSTYSLLYIPNTIGALIYGIGNAFAAAFYDNTYSYLSANIIGSYSGEMTSRVVAKEIYLSMARCTSMALILLSYRFLPESIYLKVSVTLLSLFTILVYKILIQYK